MTAMLDDEVADLRRANAELKQRLEESLAERDENAAQRAAMAEILEAINALPGDLAPVFDAILERALRLCDAVFGMMHSVDGESLRMVALRNVPNALAEVLTTAPIWPDPERSFLGRAASQGLTIHVADLTNEQPYLSRAPLAVASAELGGIRTLLHVPLLRDDAVLGVLTLFRQEVRPFSEAQIALLQSFAAQAVIAMENARLLGELRQRTDDLQESLEYQTATSDVLKVISQSGAALERVLTTLIETAVRICDADKGVIVQQRNGLYHMVAPVGLTAEFEEFTAQHPGQPGRGSVSGRALLERRVVHIEDVASDPEYTWTDGQKIGQLHTALGVPLLREDGTIGVLNLWRERVEPFTEKQIELVTSFADQAVIAIENARLITETREALEQQTATAEVLQIINASPGDLDPVFDAMLERATRLSDAVFGIMQVYDGEHFRTVATRNMPPALAEFLLRTPRQPTPHSAVRRILDGEDFVQFEDMTSEPGYLSGDPRQHAFVELGGTRTYVAVALRKEGRLLGTIATYRQEVRPFSEKQIALLQNFAAQAVIAMENARLLTETREALEQQTATAEVLQVINSSPGDLAPVFDTILEKAHSLCDIAQGSLELYDGEWFRAVAVRGLSDEFAEILRQGCPATDNPATRPLLEGSRFAHILNLAETDYTVTRSAAELDAVRTLLCVPLRRDDRLLGMIASARREVRPFSEKEIASLENFAAQAVIAMENARLLTETREALEQQTATAEVLQVINASPGDLSPVFEAILEKAHTLCGIDFGALQLNDGGKFRSVAARGLSETLAELLRRPFEPVAGSPPSRLLGGERIIHVADMAELAQRPTGDARAQAVAQDGFRTGLFVPLRKDADLLGYIVALRREVRLYSDKEIALLENFTAQAVIAMENARLLTETREALEQQTATAEVLQVINSSPGDLTPVFDEMLERAMRLCEAKHGYMYTHDGERLRTTAVRGEPQFVEFMRGREPVIPGTPLERALRSGGAVFIADCTQEEVYNNSPGFKQLIDVGGIRTGIILPLFKEATFLGSIHIFRQEVRPFSDKQIALLQNFAAQAVIAMENARLLTETREALAQQTATAEVLQVINSSPGDLTPVFDAMLEKATRLCEAPFGILRTWDGERFHFGAVHGDPRFCDWVRQRGPIRTDSDASLLGRIQAGERVVHITDAQNDEAYRVSAGFREMAAASSIRSAITVTLHKDDVLLGIITVYRQEVRPFTDKQIALLQNFAAQAVIAIENARLITETREALEQQTATAEVLQVINSSPGDLDPVFDAMLEKALRLCDAAFGVLHTFDGEAASLVALRNVPKEFADFLNRGPIRPDSANSFLGKCIYEQHTVNVSDNAAGEPYHSGAPLAVAAVELGGIRSLLHVPLIKDDTVLGVFTIFRQEVRPFSDKQIALLQNFAAQAVIAIENARLITETREALEQQTATAEVLQVINSSPGDLAPVFDAILDRAQRVCGVDHAALELLDGDRFHAVAVHGASDTFAETLRRGYPATDSPAGRALLEGQCFAEIADAAQIDHVAFRAAAELDGIRTVLFVPLRREDVLLGMIASARREVRPFSEKEIALLQNFAAQAVIAIENARLLDEIRQRQAELRVTFDHMADGVVMFDEDLRLAAWNRNFQQILDLPDALLIERPSYAEYLRVLANRGEFGTDDIEAELSRRLEDTDQELRFERTRPDGRVIEVRRNSVPDGGFVLIYSDITERKRSEAEIHAARDAAEAAYRDLKAAQANLIQAEKMASLGQLTAGIAHEIKNPLNFVNNFAGLSVELLDELKETAAPAITALDGEKRAEIDETIEMLTGNLEKIAEHGRRADNIVKSMLEHSRGSSGERRSVDLNALIEDALNLAYHGGRAQDQSFNITLERDYAAGLPAFELVPQDITRVCLNLFGNGFYATTKRQREGGDPNFKPTLRVSTRDLGEAVEVRIRDNGVGIPAEIKDKLFQPFFTTKPTGEGTGLGLSISYDIVTQQHGGTITVDSRVSEYTEFTVRLPRTHLVTMAEAAS